MMPTKVNGVSASQRRCLKSFTVLPLGLLLCVSLSGSSLLTDAITVTECSVKTAQLPRSFEPENYNLFIRPDFTDFTYEGKVSIKLHRTATDQAEAGQPGCEVVSGFISLRSRQVPKQADRCDSSTIILHASADLQVNEVQFVSGDGEQAEGVKVTSICRDAENDLLVVRLSSQLAANSNGLLELNFGGAIRRNVTEGFYLTESSDPESLDKLYIATTNFESAQARKAFPCFDEPDFKATFDLTVEHASNLKAESNTPATSEESAGEGYTRVTFATTPRQSTDSFAYTIEGTTTTDELSSVPSENSSETPESLAESFENVPEPVEDSLETPENLAESSENSSESYEDSSVPSESLSVPLEESSVPVENSPEGSSDEPTPVSE